MTFSSIDVIRADCVLVRAGRSAGISISVEIKRTLETFWDGGRLAPTGFVHWDGEFSSERLILFDVDDNKFQLLGDDVMGSIWILRRDSMIDRFGKPRWNYRFKGDGELLRVPEKPAPLDRRGVAVDMFTASNPEWMLR